MTMRFVNKLAAVAAVSLGSVGAFAAAPDYTVLTTAVDFSTVGTAILAVAALQVVPAVVIWGARKVKGFIGR